MFSQAKAQRLQRNYFKSISGEKLKIKNSKGECSHCKQEITGNQAAKHFSVCSKRLDLIKMSVGKKTPSENLYHLRTQDAGNDQFWLDLEMRGSATLKDLDSYLRAIWLECCGHMSRFSIGSWEADEIPKKQRVDEVFCPGVKLMHIYDSGTSSQTLIKIMGTRQGKPVTTRPISLMARNYMPESKCAECGKASTKLCMECLIEEDTWRTFCEKHAQTHPHENYGEPVRLVNSPRLGMCGYEGPAEPPY